MLIYAVADIHSQTHKIQTIETNILKYQPDLLVIAGDLTRYFNPLPTIKRIGALALPVLIIRGNTDSKRIESFLTAFPNIRSPHLKKETLEGLSFVGLNGTIPIPFRSQINLLERWSRSIDPLMGANTVLIAHPPPRGTLDSVFFNLHAGCPKIREVILRRKPLLYICGHIHESTGTQYLGKTLVVNCSIGKTGEGVLIEVKNESISRVDILSSPFKQ